jgi:hypothetical protein
MDDTKLKYVRINGDEFIIFAMTLDHSTFKYLNPISAGFCYVDQDKVDCFGESHTLKMDGLIDDTIQATKQVFGVDAMLKLL